MVEVRRRDGEVIWLPDIRKISMLNRKLITSRKRTRNLFDLAGNWKRIVLEQLEARITTEIDIPEQPVIPLVPDDIQTGRVNVWRPPRDIDEDMDLPRRASPPLPKGWF
jgi:hypothetical protein